jgi:hypothetical protein
LLSWCHKASNNFAKPKFKCNSDENAWCLQLRSEQRGGRVFPGWNEGRIYFPPTYKYSNNSDRYAGEDINQKEKRRTPAW